MSTVSKYLVILTLVMPSKKRGRLDSDEEEGEVGGAKLCGNGHPLVLVPKEVRRLEKDKTWSCDGEKCQLDWDGENGTLYLERARYRCVHYHSQGPCNYDLCGDCYYSSPGKEAGVRRSLRESRPSSIRREEEWQMDKRAKVDKYSPSDMSPGRVGRRSRDGHSPGSILTNGIRKISPSKKSPTTAEVSPRRTRGGDHNRSGSRKTPNSTHSPGDHSRPRSMRARNGARNDYVEDTESTGESDLNNTKDDVDSPFFPNGHHVRFSPSAKNNQTENGRSPFGRKTRSSRRGLSSYIQSLPSEDEQSEFNRHYRSDLRRRQQRKASEEDSQEAQDTKSTRRSGRRRMDSETSGAEELSLAQRKSMRSMRRQNEKILNDEEDDSEGVGDPTVTEASLRRSSRRRGSGAAPAGEEADTESGVEKHDSEEEEVEEEEADVDAEEEEEVAEEETKECPRLTRRSSGRQRGVVISEPDDTPVLSRSRRTNRKLSSEEEEEDEDEAEDKDLEDGELEDENEDNDESRRSSRRHRQPVNRYQPGLEEPTPRGRDGSDESSEEEEEQTSRRRATRNTKKKSPLKRRQYGLREKRNEVRRYTDTPNPNVRDQGLLRRDTMVGTNIPRGGGRGRANDKDRRRRHRTGDSSSPTDSDSSDEEAFEKRKSKRMRIEMERMRPMNMSKNDVNKAVFRDRTKAGSSMADIQPMEMDMGVTFDNVGGLKEQVHSLKEMVMFPLLYPEMFKKFDIQPPRGVLFYGPPGTGKTLLARALASECSSENKKVAFFMRKGADCLSKWIGESERQLRMLFDQAYQMRPSIIFFDEIDGLAPVRSSRQDQIHSSIVSTLLALMDGLDNRGEIVVIGATNRIENIDPALRRPGRFDREFRFFLPDRKTRKEIIKLHTKTWDPPISEPLLNTLGTKTIGYCGADLKGLTAEAALNSLRRSFPQVYESNQKLAIDMNVVQVRKCDFDKALRKIVPSTHRVEDRVLGPLPKQVRPLLSQTLTNLTHHIKKIFPHCRLGKTAVLPATLTHRPRLLIVANEGQGATTYLAPALLHFMEKLPVTKLDIAALFSNSARTPEEAVTSLIHLARRTQPGILFIPHLAKLWSVSSETVRATLCTALADCPPNAPMLVLAVSNVPHHQLDESVQHLFNIHYRETYRVENPGENERREFFRPLVSACSQPPYQPPPPPPPRESLAVLPAPECRALTEREEKRLKRKEAALLRELRIFLRDIWTKIHRENKFFMFRMPVNTDEVDDYLKYVKTPMDFESMHVKLDDGEYTCAQVSVNNPPVI